MSKDVRIAARWIVPVMSPPVEGGVVTVRDSRIISVETNTGQAVDRDLGDVVLLPGLVNAHTHLDLTGARGLIPPSRDFTGWLKRVIAFRRTRSAEQVAQDIQAGIAECKRYGTALVGDIAAGGMSLNAMRESDLCGTVFYECLGLIEERWSESWGSFLNWIEPQRGEERITCGISPHAPYSVQKSGFHTYPYPTSIHIAETREELDLLDHRTGPFVNFLKDFNVYHPDNLATHEEILVGMRDTQTLWIHANYLPELLWQSIGPRQSVVICPRTHAAFGHEPHPYRRMLDRGIRVAVGTDSLASNPDLNVLAEIQHLHRIDSTIPPETLVRMATLNGAEALGRDRDFGSISTGKRAKFAVISMGSATDPFQAIVHEAGSVRGFEC